MIKNHINKNNLHHAYLIQGDKETISEISNFLKEDFDFNISNNPDFYLEIFDTFKIEDARNLKLKTSNKNFSNDENSKKIFVLYINNFLLEAQNSLLKVFEEPILNTHFFVISPNLSMFIPTLLSRFYVIRKDISLEENEIVKNFIKMSKRERINFIKDFLKKEEDEEIEDSQKTKVFNFLNDLEFILSRNKNIDKKLFSKFFEVRKILREVGSSPKMLLENIALQIPE